MKLLWQVEYTGNYLCAATGQEYNGSRTIRVYAMGQHRVAIAVENSPPFITRLTLWTENGWKIIEGMPSESQQEGLERAIGRAIMFLDGYPPSPR